MLRLALALLLVVPGLISLVWLTALTWQPHWPGAVIVLLGVIVAPVIEEIVFRGGVQEWLIARGWGGSADVWWPSPANIVTSLLFALGHLLHHPPLWALSMGLPSLVFGLLYEHRRHLGPPITAHSVYNAAYLLLLAPI